MNAADSGGVQTVWRSKDAKSLVQISSAVSAVLRCENFSRVGAAGAEHCGYGDLR